MCLRARFGRCCDLAWRKSLGFDPSAADRNEADVKDGQGFHKDYHGDYPRSDGIAQHRNLHLYVQSVETKLHR